MTSNSNNTPSRPARSWTPSGVLALLRPRQWVKNGFVLLPLLFAGQYTSPSAVLQALSAAAMFCLASSAAYIVNDLRDIERDRRHPTKRLSRPLAAGIVRPAHAYALLALLYGLLLASAAFLPEVFIVITVYLLINWGYSLGLKNVPVLDIFMIASGFVLRVKAGASALHVPMSAWMFVTTLCLALFMASIKRRKELSGSGAAGREVLGKYSPALIDRYAEMSATGALVFYSLFCMSEHAELVMTIPVVLFGLFRYWYVVEHSDAGESPTDLLLSDLPLQFTIAVWLVLCAWQLRV